MSRLIFLFFSVFTASFIFAQTPIAQFTVDQTSVCAGFPITFTDLSNYGGAAVISTNWDFGQGGSSTATNPTYTYANAGTYIVLLTVISTGGTDFEQKASYITVNPNPLANFTTSGNGCTVPFAVTFTNTSSVGAGINYSWDFGNTQTSVAINPPAVTYNASGTFPVQLIVTNSITGCTKTISKNLVVSDYAAAITVAATGCVDQVVTITDASTVGADTWSWTSGNGQSSIVQNPSFTYAAAGTYTIGLTSQNSVSGCSSTITKSITINTVPIPSFTATPLAGCSPLSVAFTNTSGPGTYLWVFGNGSTSTMQNPPAKTYIANGVYDVSLTKTDANGCVGTTTIPAMITVGPPVAAFSSDLVNGCAPLPVTFTDISTSPNPIADPIVSWLWTFGDGATSTLQNPPAHTYAIGTFNVSLEVTTQSGCNVTTIMNSYVQVGMIDLVDFSLFPINECAKKDITFTDLSVISTPHTANEVTYRWDFGDNGSSTLKDPLYNYPIDTGAFDIQLVVTFRGCNDTLERTNQIYIKAPISRYTVPALYCNPVAFPVVVNVVDNAISGTSTDNVDMIWRWGDGTEDLLISADVFDLDQGSSSHSYASYGTYEIKQLIRNYTTGCEDSTTQTIFITSMDAGFTLSNDTVCNNLPLTLTSTSVFLDPIADFTYTMGDGGITTGNPANYTYTVPGSYTISLRATNSVGCSDSSKFLGFTVLEPPLAQLTADVYSGCLPITVTYSNSSLVQGNGVPLKSFLWSFPDGSSQTTNSVATTTNFPYISEGFFGVNLVATDLFGCVSPSAFTTMFITNPAVSYTFDPVVCNSELVVATNGTTGFGNLTYTWKVDNVSVAQTTDYSTQFNEVSSNSYTNIAHIIKLIASDGNGCKDSISNEVKVSLPVANLNNIASGATANGLGEYTCPPVFETFTDNSTSFGTITEWNWVFGDGKSSAFKNPNNTYIYPGTYTLSLNITNEYGCTSDTILTDYLTILGPEGTMDWVALGDPCLRQYQFDLTNPTFVDSVIWRMDDGDTVFMLNSFTHVYPVGTHNPTCSLIDALGCKVTYPMNTISVSPISIASLAGVDQAFCGNSAVLAGNNDPNGTGVWTTVSGIGTVDDTASPTSTVSAIGVGVSKYVWTVSNACEVVRDTIVMTITDVSTISSAGPDQNMCINSTILAGNTAMIGVGAWSLASGTATITDPLNPLSGLTSIGVGVNKLVWTIAGTCSVTTDTVVITLETPPTLPLANVDQTICPSNTVFDGNIPLSGTGIWTLFSGSGIISIPTIPNSPVTGINVGESIFVWTVSNSCNTYSDTVKIIRETIPTIAAAGVDQIICSPTTTLAGNTALIGTGTWTLVIGTGTVTLPADPLSGVIGLTPGINKFVWTILNTCATTNDTVYITVENQPTIPLAGPDQQACIPNSVLVGNIALIGTSIWTKFSGTGTITTPSSPVSTITGLPLGPHVFVWTISNTCASNSDTVEVLGVDSPTASNAGPDQNICITSATLHSNKPIVGVGEWSLISGAGVITDITDSLSTVTGLGVGRNVFEWKIASFCGDDANTVEITVETPPTIADAGISNALCATNLTSTNLAANSALVGIGTWSSAVGSPTVFSDIHSEVSSITNLSIGPNVYTWTIENSCSSSSSPVTITRVITPNPAKAGNDTTMCISALAKLKGNFATIGIGTWTVITGTGVITNPSDSLSTVTGMSAGVNTFRWTISNICDVATNFDEVTITIDALMANANAGPDQNPICGTTSTLAATPVTIGIGRWTQVPVVPGQVLATITDPSLPNSTITNLGLGINQFKWTVTNTCPTKDAVVIINRVEIPTTASTTDVQPICSNNSVLTGNLPIIGNGLWSIVPGKGSGNISDVTNPISNVSNLGIGENIFKWTISNGCGSSSKTVKITLEIPAIPADVGPNQEGCGDNVFLDGRRPSTGFGKWDIVSGEATINDPTDSITGVVSLGVGETIFRWTVSNSCGSSFKDLTIINTGLCPDEDSLKNLLIYFIPNAFTPHNNDKLNPTFLPKFISGYEPLEYTLLIFDRWGHLIFESHDAGIGWDGTLGNDNRYVEDGVYVWKIQYTDINTQKEQTILGHVVLIR